MNRFVSRSLPRLLRNASFLIGIVLFACANPLHAASWTKQGSKTAIPAALRNAIEGDGWVQTQQVTEADPQFDPEFGYAVAVHGRTAMIGAQQAKIGDNNSQGAVYVYEQADDGTWSRTQKLVADDGQAADTFGHSIVFEGDTALIGAYAAQIGENFSQGAVYVFTLSDGTWTQTQKLVAADGTDQSYFGAAVTLDGDHAFVGAYAATINGNFGQGAVYAYSGVTGESLQPSGEIINPDGVANDQFGYAVAAHGGSVMIGSPNTKVGDNAAQGAVFLYEDIGGSWTQAQEIVAVDGVTNDAFGLSVSYDDLHALVGVPVGNGFLGEFYAFTLDAGTWTQTQKILAPDGATDIFYAVSVALSGDRAVVTYPGYGSGQGRVDLFGLDAAGDWNLLQAYEHPSGDPADLFPYYGFSAGISGGTFLVGAYGRKVGDNLYQGASYFYTRDDLFSDGFDGG